MKPANNTKKETTCTYSSASTCTASGGTGGTAAATIQASSKSDSSKKYGNGKTAAQVAAGNGLTGTATIYGPGNSQPHKVSCPGAKHSPDVHALKTGTAACSTSTAVHTSSSTSVSSSVHTSSNVSSSNTTNVSSAPNTTSNTGVAGTTQTQTQATGGVQGTTTNVASPKVKHAKHGVLGTVTKVNGGALPFTGFPLWLAALVGLGLIGGGLALRGRAAGARV
jgi:hypothetical protein